MGELFTLFLGAAIINNIILTRFLGMCPFLGVSKKSDSALGMGAAVTFVIVVSSIVTYFLYHNVLVLLGLEYMDLITFILVIASFVQLVEMIIKNIERDKYTKVIHEELNKLGIEFTRYKERWDKLSRSIQTVNKDVENFSITTDKLSKKFQSINKVEIKELENTDLE